MSGARGRRRATAAHALLDARLHPAPSYRPRAATPGGDAILTCAADGRCLDANAAATELLGYSRDELRQQHLSDLLVRAEWER